MINPLSYNCEEKYILFATTRNLKGLLYEVSSPNSRKILRGNHVSIAPLQLAWY